MRAISIAAVVLTMLGTRQGAQAVMEQLPLFKARLVDYQYTALGPLMPLRVLLAPQVPPKP